MSKNESQGLIIELVFYSFKDSNNNNKNNFVLSASIK